MALIDIQRARLENELRPLKAELEQIKDLEARKKEIIQCIEALERTIAEMTQPEKPQLFDVAEAPKPKPKAKKKPAAESADDGDVITEGQA